MTVTLGLIKETLFEKASAPIVIDPSGLGARFYRFQSIRINFDRLLVIAVFHVCFLNYDVIKENLSLNYVIYHKNDVIK